MIRKERYCDVCGEEISGSWYEAKECYERFFVERRKIMICKNCMIHRKSYDYNDELAKSLSTLSRRVDTILIRLRTLELNGENKE